MTTRPSDTSPDEPDPDDAPVLTNKELRDAEFYHGNTFIARGVRQPRTEPSRELVSLRLDADLLARLRATGPGWQTRVNALLARAIADHPDLLKPEEEGGSEPPPPPLTGG